MKELSCVGLSSKAGHGTRCLFALTIYWYTNELSITASFVCCYINKWDNSYSFIVVIVVVITLHLLNIADKRKYCHIWFNSWIQCHVTLHEIWIELCYIIGLVYHMPSCLEVELYYSINFV